MLHCKGAGAAWLEGSPAPLRPARAAFEVPHSGAPAMDLHRAALAGLFQGTSAGLPLPKVDSRQGWGMPSLQRWTMHLCRL
jgi:hypothetical protein